MACPARPPRGTWSSKDLAEELVERAWMEHGIDPVVLICLVIPLEDLRANTDFGAALHEVAMEIIGAENLHKLDLVIERVKAIMQDRQAHGHVLQGGFKAAHDVTRNFGKNRVVEDLRAARPGPPPRVFAPAVAQFVTSNNKRSFRAYRYQQDMVDDVCQTLLHGPRDVLQVVEAPLGRAGVIRLYVDAEMYLSRMPCCEGGSREVSTQRLRDLAEQLPLAMSKAYTGIGVVCPKDVIEFVVKENSRDLENGDYKVSHHVITNILVTCKAFDDIQKSMFAYVQIHAPLFKQKIRERNFQISAKELLTLGKWAPMLFCDMASTKHTQMLRCAYSRKSTADTRILVPKHIVAVCNGARVESPPPAAPQGFCASGIQESMPHLTPVESRGALWDTLICVPSPRCRGGRVQAVAMHACPVKRKGPLDLSGHSGQPHGQGKRICSEPHEVWDRVPAWFREWAVGICKGVQRLPQHRVMSYTTGRPSTLAQDADVLFLVVGAPPTPACKTVARHVMHTLHGGGLAGTHEGVHIVCAVASVFHRCIVCAM